MTRSEDGDIICLQNAGAVAMRGGLVVFARVGSNRDEAVEAMPRAAKTLGLPGTSRDLFFTPPPPAAVVAETSRRWERMGQHPFA